MWMAPQRCVLVSLRVAGWSKDLLLSGFIVWPPISLSDVANCIDYHGCRSNRIDNAVGGSSSAAESELPNLDRKAWILAGK
jgi:hypothetical protein